MATTDTTSPPELDVVEVTLPWLDRPGLLHIPSMTIIPPLSGADDGDDEDQDDDGDQDGDDSDDDSDDDSSDDEGDDEADEDDDGKSSDDKVNLKRESRKHERRWKREKAAREKAERELAEVKKGRKTAEQKAIDDAKAAGRQEALSEFEKTRRADRLEVAVTRLSTKGIALGEGDDAKKVKFADPEDVLMYLERRINRGDLDAGDVYDDDGKVRVDALTEELAELAEDKPQWLVGAAGDTGKSGRSRTKGDSDAGKGSSGSGEDSVEAHLGKVRRHAPATK